MYHDFYADRRYCPSCDAYVRYLYSPRGCYCVQCGALSHLFSGADRDSFRSAVRSERRAFGDRIDAGEREAG